MTITRRSTSVRRWCVRKGSYCWLVLFRFLIVVLMANGMSTVANAGNDVNTRANSRIIKVPTGNRNISQPDIPGGAKIRTQNTKSSFDAKYDKIYALLSEDKKLIGKIKVSSARFGIDPIHIIGALVGEHTYNVDALDRIQTYYVKAMAYFGSELSFKFGDEKITDFIARPQFAKCAVFDNSYDLWACRENIWEKMFKGKKVDGVAWPKDRFGRVFFQPYYAGQTFGLGQLNPLTALRVTDMVVKKTKARRLDAKRAPLVYKEIMDPDSTLDYMAAVIKTAIDAYRSIAGYDISKNPGLTATLYNLGDVKNRASRLAARNKRGAGGKTRYPEENYYGWLVNNKESELRDLL